MTMTSKDIRRLARESMQGNWGVSILICLIFVFLRGGYSVDLDVEELETLFGELPKFLSVYLTVVGSIASILGFVNFILGGVLELGHTAFLLKQQDRQALSVKELFSQFHRFGQGFLQALLRGLYVFLWSLLFVIPGVVKTYSYFMTPYIMIDYPELSANEAITWSRQAMDGHKFDLFCLHLSFIGWAILSLLTLGIGDLFLLPYMYASYAVFYRNVICPKIQREILEEDPSAQVLPPIVDAR